MVYSKGAYIKMDNLEPPYLLPLQSFSLFLSADEEKGTFQFGLLHRVKS